MLDLPASEYFGIFGEFKNGFLREKVVNSWVQSVGRAVQLLARILGDDQMDINHGGHEKVFF